MPKHVGREQGLCQQHVPVPVPRLRTSAVPSNLHPLPHWAEIRQWGQKLPGEQPQVCAWCLLPVGALGESVLML